MRTWFASWSLRRRLVVIILALAIPTVLAVAGVALGANVMILQDETQAAFLSQNQAFANALDSRLQSAATVARAFANSLSNQPDSPLSRVWQMANNTLSETGQIIRRVNVYAPLDGGRQVVVFNAPIPPVRVATGSPDPGSRAHASAAWTWPDASSTPRTDRPWQAAMPVQAARHRAGAGMA